MSVIVLTCSGWAGSKKIKQTIDLSRYSQRAKIITGYYIRRNFIWFYDDHQRYILIDNTTYNPKKSFENIDVDVQDCTLRSQMLPWFLMCKFHSRWHPCECHLAGITSLLTSSNGLFARCMVDVTNHSYEKIKLLFNLTYLLIQVFSWLHHRLPAQTKEFQLNK